MGSGTFSTRSGRVTPPAALICYFFFLLFLLFFFIIIILALLSHYSNVFFCVLGRIGAPILGLHRPVEGAIKSYSVKYLRGVLIIEDSTDHEFPLLDPIILLRNDYVRMCMERMAE